MRRLLKAAVNTLTAVGGGMALVSLLYSFGGDPRWALVLMLGAVVVDGIDGTLVRALDLKHELSEYDGDRLDEYADLVTFVVAPLGFGWATEVLPVTALGVGTGMVVFASSLWQFAWEHAKSERAFWGWPSYWNVVYFYAWALEFPALLTILLSLVLSATVFAPVAFVYPTRFPVLRPLTVTLSGLWGGMVLVYLLRPTTPSWVLGVSLLFPLYYMVLTLVVQRRLHEPPIS